MYKNMIVIWLIVITIYMLNKDVKYKTRCFNIKENSIKENIIKRNDIKRNDIKGNDIKRNDIKRNDIIENQSQVVDLFEYAGSDLVYNNDPSNRTYYFINSIGNKLNIPNADALMNKSLYMYEPGTIIKPIIEEDIYSDILLLRNDIDNNCIIKNNNDKYMIRYDIEKEEYFR
jgi:hypothetical protein